MKIRWLICCIMCICICIVPAAASSTVVSRAVEPAGDVAAGTYTVTLIIEDMEIGGIVEYLPTGCAVASCDYASDHTRMGDHQVAFAILEPTTTISYTVTCEPDAPDLITGSWINLLEGTNGTVGSTPVTHTEPSTMEEAPTTSAPLSLIPAIGAICAISLAIARRRCIE